jgi:hypothetical protein
MGLISALIGWRLPLTPMACGKGEVTVLLPAFFSKQGSTRPSSQVVCWGTRDSEAGPSTSNSPSASAVSQLQSLKVTELPRQYASVPNLMDDALAAGQGKVIVSWPFADFQISDFNFMK